MGAIRLTAAAIMLALLAGCAQGLPTPAANPGTSITVTPEAGGRFLSFVGPKTPHDPPFLGVPGTNYVVLRSLLDTRTGQAVTQLYVEDSYMGAERNWNVAQDAAGKKLRFVPISRNQITCDNGCSYAEEFAADLPDDLLKSSHDGVRVFFTAKSGARMTILIPQEQITNQLAAIASARAGLAPKATPVQAPSPAPTGAAPQPAASR